MDGVAVDVARDDGCLLQAECITEQQHIEDVKGRIKQKGRRKISVSSETEGSRPRLYPCSLALLMCTFM